MSRQYCIRCQRPLVTCICDLVTIVNNHIDVWFLQHPLEVKQSKGSVTLAHLSLQHSRVLIGENFSQCSELNQIINNPIYQVLLLYPGESAQQVTTLELKKQQKTVLVILDGTWKKAYKMYQLSTNLQQLDKVTLAESIKSQYRIRKHHKETDLSSLEACAHALGVLEGDISKYQSMLTSFTQFNELQLQLSNKGNASQNKSQH